MRDEEAHCPSLLDSFAATAAAVAPDVHVLRYSKLQSLAAHWEVQRYSMDTEQV